jgi:hypothetical protein
VGVDRLVAADVHIGRGEQLAGLVQNVLQELDGGFLAGAQQGAASDSFGQTGATAVLALGAFYLLFFWRANKA